MKGGVAGVLLVMGLIWAVGVWADSTTAVPGNGGGCPSGGGGGGGSLGNDALGPVPALPAGASKCGAACMALSKGGNNDPVKNPP